MVIGREEEIKKLNNMYCSGTAELVALYGRRRVGKTFLIDEVFDKKICFRHAGLSPIDSGNQSEKNGQMENQLKHFYRSLTVSGYEGKNKPKTWLDAFYMLEDLLMEKYDDEERVLVFIDEIQWLDTPKAGFMTGFEAFWNGWACHRKNVMVIVCGSSSSWILDHVINNHGGLYGRVTYEMKLHPFSLRECEEFFEAMDIHMSRYDVAQAYMAVGGIPYYLKYFVKELSLPQNIDSLFFAEKAPLKDEFDRMFSSLFVNPEAMRKIVKAIGSKNKGLSRAEIVKSTGLTDSGELSKQLKALIAGDFLVKYSSFGESKRETYYKLTDPFSLFYMTFVEENKGKKNIEWANIEDTSRVNVWKGYAYENICWSHIKQIKSALGISGVSTTESLWSKRGDEESKGTQIDLIIERKDNVVNMCEIKFYSDEFVVDKDYHLVMEHRKALLREKIAKKASVHNTLITTFGVKRIGFYGDFTHVLTLDDLFV